MLWKNHPRGVCIPQVRQWSYTALVTPPGMALGQPPEGFRVPYRHGQRCHFIREEESSDYREEESSNYRELANLVFALEEVATKGQLDQNEIFMLTDYLTAEAAFSKGTTSNRKLFHLLLQL